MTPTIIYCRTYKNLTATVTDVNGNFYFQVYAVNPENNRTGLKTSQPGSHSFCVEQFNDCNLEQMAFTDWMAAVDRHLVRKMGLSHHDLPDYDYRIAYDGDQTPAEVADEAIKWARTF